MSPRIKTCFISAAFGEKLGIVKDVLDQNGVRVLGTEDANFGQSLYENALDVINRADLFIGVLSHNRTSQNVLFELGVAIGLGKQVVIFEPPKADLIPFNLQHFLVIRTSLQNRDAIAFALGQILSAPERSSVPIAGTPRSGRGLGHQADEFIGNYSDIIMHSRGWQLEELVASAIRASGVEIVSESFRENARVDLAVWSDALQSSVGNPLLIEVKRKLLSKQEFRRAAEQLASAARDAGSTWGLLLYGEGPTKLDFSWIPMPTVLIISIREILEAMRTATFVDVVRDLRNRRVHGVHDGGN